MASSMSSPDSDDPLGIGKKLRRRQQQCLNAYHHPHRNHHHHHHHNHHNNNGSTTTTPTNNNNINPAASGAGNSGGGGVGGATNNNKISHKHNLNLRHQDPRHRCGQRTGIISGGGGGGNGANCGSGIGGGSVSCTGDILSGAIGRLQLQPQHPHHPHHQNPSDRFAHKNVEENIECFLETFRHKTWSVDPSKGGPLDRRASSDSGDSSGWTSSALSTTDDLYSTDSPEYPDNDSGANGAGLAGVPPGATSGSGTGVGGSGSGRWRDSRDKEKEKGIIAESRRITRWAWRQSRYSCGSPQPSPCACTYHPPWSAMEETPDQHRVIDVASLLQGRYAILSGGKAKNDAPIITFPTRPGQPEVPDDEYGKVVSYLCGITPLHESECGVVIVVDRRQDGWGAVKSILLKLSSYFPVHIQVVFLLQPKGFFQRAFADIRSKFLKEDLEFKVVLCDDHREMEEYVDISQLTTDIGGDIEFDALEWTEHRSAVEKFSKNTCNISQCLSATVKKMEERELPNEMIETEAMLRVCMAERKELLEDIGSSVAHGNTLLKCIKGDQERTPLTKLCHVLELERLLVQLEESETGFGEFWDRHEGKLKQCLSLRQFEEEFKLVQFSMGRRLETLQDQMEQLGSSVTDVETLISEFESMEEESQLDLDQAERMRTRGLQLMMDDHYAVDSIRPKCIELQRMCEQYKELLRNRREVLTKSHDLHDRLDRANKWCSNGVDLLSSQPVEKQQSGQWAVSALHDVQAFVRTSKELKLSNPREFRQLFEDIMTQEYRATVQKTLQRMEDVQRMCAKRQERLQQIISPRSLQASQQQQQQRQEGGGVGGGGSLTPGGHHPHAPHQGQRAPRDRSQQRRQPHQQQHDEVDAAATTTPAATPDGKRLPVKLEKSVRYRPDTTTNNNNHNHNNSDNSNNHHNNNSSREKSPSDLPSPLSHRMNSQSGSDVSSTSDTQHSDAQDSSISNASMNSFESDSLHAKRKHVMAELIDTEVTYVNEMHQILQGYYYVMDHKSEQMMIPPLLLQQRHILFGNLPEIYKFHKDTFLQELKNCRDDPCKVGRCFVNRKEEFQMYSIYCQNKPKSEELRMSVGDSNAFFKDCQNKLGHRLPLGAYLLKPVQRITKYQLLLKEMLRFAGTNAETSSAIKEAVDTMLSVLAYLNDSMHQVNIQGFDENLADQGRLVLHGEFRVWTEHKHDRIRDMRLRSMQRHVFLFQKAVLLCKRREDTHSNDNPSYTFKNKLKLCQVGLTEKIKGDKRKFELWLRGREEVYICQAPNLDTKNLWVAEIKKVLLSQFDLLKESRRAPVTISNEDNMMSRVSSGESSDVSFDSWRSPDVSSSTKHSTVPIGLEMSSPLVTPTSPPYRMEEDVEEGDDDEEDGGAWSSEFSDDDTMQHYIPTIEPSYKEHFVSLGDYFVVDPTELALSEGDTVEVMRVGKNGWWYARHLRTDQEGWVPSTYLEPISRVSSLYSSSDSLIVVGARNDMSRSPSGGSYHRGPSPVPETTV